jgi:hypothetical protein
VQSVNLVCTVDHGFGSGYGNLGKAKAYLVQNGFFSSSDFNGIVFKWCKPLGIGASGMVPAPNVILLSRSYRHSSMKKLAPLIGHEMVHIKQIRRKGYHRFACQYSGEILSGKGTTRGNFLEGEAYRKEDEISESLSW